MTLQYAGMTELLIPSNVMNSCFSLQEDKFDFELTVSPNANQELLKYMIVFSNVP